MRCYLFVSLILFINP